MASLSSPPPAAASSASTLYEWPCSGSEMPRYSRRKCAASNRASTRTEKLSLTILREDECDDLVAHAESTQFVGSGLGAKQSGRVLVIETIVRPPVLRQRNQRQ